MSLLKMSLWILPPAILQAALLWALIRRKQYKAFPLFFSYTVFAIAAGLVRLGFYKNAAGYFWSYWFTEAVLALLGAAVVIEVYWKVFRGFHRIWWFRPIFPIAVGLSVTTAILRAFEHSSGVYNSLMIGITAAETAVRMLQVEIFVLLVLLIPFFGLRWQRYSFGIAAGFGFYSTIALLGTTKFYEFGTRFTQAWGILSVVAYSIGILIWLWYFTGAPSNKGPAVRPNLSAKELGDYGKVMRERKKQWPF